MFSTSLENPLTPLRLRISKLPSEAFLPVFLLIIYFSLLIGANIFTESHQEFTALARAFAQGQLSFLEIPNNGIDLILFQQKIYWALGPFPAVLLVPLTPILALIEGFPLQASLNILLVAVTAVALFKTIRQLNFTVSDSLFLVFGFLAASPYFGVSLYASSWYLAQITVVGCLSLALYEWHTRRRPWVIGLLMAATLATRVTASLGVIFFILDFFQEKKSWPERSRFLFLLIVPMVIALLMLASYNYARFENPFETGYSLQNIAPELRENRAVGVFDWRHIPANLYYLFLSFPKPVFLGGTHVLTPPYLQVDPWGTSLFLSAPYYVLLLVGTYRSAQEKNLWITIGAVALPILCFYGIGYMQAGYRYALDFLPFLFFLFILQLQKRSSALSPSLKTLILFGFLINIFLFTSVFQGQKKLSLIPALPITLAA